MDLENFNGKTGKLVQASKAAYSTFEPNPLPLKIEYTEEIIKLLSEAILSLGNLSNAGRRMSNPHLLIMPYLRKEAVFSSKIEGTRTSLSEVFLHEKENKKLTTSQGQDLVEVLNYIKAVQFGLKEIKENPLSDEIIKGMHTVLMKGVRGEEKDPGRYKSHQNWIGSSEEIMEAKFVPASPGTTPDLMKNLIDYSNNYDKSTELIKAAILHYQFESIHPFRDGNGRIGRLLVILHLCRKNILSQPLLYLSAYFEKNSEKYNELLYNVSTKGEIENWLKFFLKGVKLQSDLALGNVTRLENYQEHCRKLLLEKTNSTNAIKVLDHLFANPYIKISEVQKILGTHYPTAENNVRILLEQGIIKEAKKIQPARGGRLFYAPKIIEILEVNASL